MLNQTHKKIYQLTIIKNIKMNQSMLFKLKSITS